MKILDYLDLCAPYTGAPYRKNGIEVGAALGIASLVMGTGAAVMAAEKSDAANRTNQRIHQQDIQTQWDMLRETEEYNKEVNSYAYKRADAEAAGYSPYVVTGSAPTVGVSSVPTGSQMLPTDITGFNQLANMLFSAPQMLQQIDESKANVGKIKAEERKTNADALGVEIENLFRNSNEEMKLLFNQEQALKAGYDKMASYYGQQLQKRGFWSDLEEKQLRNELLQANIEKTVGDSALAAINTALAQKQYAWIDKLNVKELELKAAQIMTEGFKQRDLGASTQLQLQGVIESQARTKGQNISNNQAAQLSKYLVRTAYFDMVKSSWDAKGSQINAWNSYDPYNREIYGRGRTKVGVAKGAFKDALDILPSIKIR